MIQFITKLITHFGVGAYKAQFIAWGIIVVLAIVLILTVVFGLKSCFKKTPKIDEQQIQKINQANEKERKAELEKIITENADVVKTVDNRSAVADVNVEARNEAIDAKIKAADKAIADAKSNGKDVTAAELECMLIPENCP